MLNQMKTYPRSAYAKVGGIVYFARMLDKIRLHSAHRLPADYHQNLGKAFDGRCSRFLGVDYSALRKRVVQDGTDEEILIWNSFMRKRGWRDEEDGTTKELENYKGRIGVDYAQGYWTGRPAPLP